MAAAVMCPRCSSPNPADARFCHHDGVLLEGVLPRSTARVGFPTPFVFSSGLSCDDFPGLAKGILSEWNASRDMLAFAEWEGFFSGLGRLDLVQAAAKARLFPDPDRGLDQLLAALPGNDLKPGALEVISREIDFGILQPGEPARVVVSLTNAGQRLVWGEASLRDAPWCSLSVETSLTDRSFQLIGDASLEIFIPEGQIRRSGRNLAGTLVLSTETGTIEIRLSAREADVLPFVGGLFDGATSPRHIAEKARTKPREAAPVFLSGKLAEWYSANGWDYPVNGPVAPGLASVQQYFEAHGFAPSPKVVAEPLAIALRAVPGEKLTERIILKTDEKRHVYGYLASAVPWITVGELEANYQSAALPLEIDTNSLTEDAPLRTTLVVVANGQQKFEIPVEVAFRVPEAAPLLDLDALAPIVEDESEQFAPVELLEGESIEEAGVLVEAEMVHVQQVAAPEIQAPKNTEASPVSVPVIQAINASPPAPIAVPSAVISSPEPLVAVAVPSEVQPSPSGDPFASPAFQPTSTKKSKVISAPVASASSDAVIPAKGKGRMLILAGSGLGILVLLVVGLIMLFGRGGGSAAGGKALVKPVIAGSETKDLLAFTVETTDQDRVTLLATDGSDKGSHFMLKTPRGKIGAVGSSKAAAKTVSKWETKDDWTRREIDLSVDGVKWRVGQWMRVLPENPKQCVVIFELSPSEDSKIGARLALRPGTGTGSTVHFAVGDKDGVVRKPTFYKADKLPEKLLIKIDKPELTGAIGLDVPEVKLPGREKSSAVDKAYQVMIGQGLDAFGSWDCTFPDLMGEELEAVVPANKGAKGKPPAPSDLKDPFAVLYWEDSPVRKGMKRVIGFTLGLDAGSEGAP